MRRPLLVLCTSAAVVVSGIAGTAALAGATRPDSALIDVPAVAEVAAGSADSDPLSGHDVGRSEQRELLMLLLAGTGPVAEARPELVEALGFAADRPAVDEAALSSLVTRYLRHDRDFAETADALSSGDPVAVRDALESFTDSFHGFLRSEGRVTKRGDQVAADGCGWKGCFAVTLYVTANVAVYANVAGATNAVATLVVTWFYLMDADGQTTQIERDRLVSLVASSLDTTT